MAVIEDGYRDKNGRNISLNLTNFTLWGILNHADLTYSNPNCHVPNYINQFVELSSHNGGDKEAWSFEGYIVKIADQIAMWHHDLEDAIRGNALSIPYIRKTIKKSMEGKLSEYEKELLRNVNTTTLDHKQVTDLSHILINTLVTDVISVSEGNLIKIENEVKSKFPEDVFKNNTECISEKFYRDYDNLGLSIKRENVIAMSLDIDTDRIYKVISGAVHQSSEVERMNEKGKYIIRKLFEAFYAHPLQLPTGPLVHYLVECNKLKYIDEMYVLGSGKIRRLFSESVKDQGTTEKLILMRRICDYIAAMTDRYAIEEYNNLYA